MKSLSIICLISLFATPVYSQSAENFDLKTIEPDQAEKKTTETSEPETQEAGPVTTNPSRYAGTDLEAYIQSLSAVFAIRGRATDPFALYQDPEAKPVIRKPTITAVNKPAAVVVVPFSDIVAQIPVTTVMPGEKRFLVGTRSFSQGDKLPLVFDGKEIRSEVVEVSSQRIVFRNLDNGETAVRELAMLPPGMTQGNGSITAPGMVRDKPDAPLEIQNSLSEEDEP
jgi:hypothetical protein